MYLKQQLIIFCKLCAGRNSHTVNALTKGRVVLTTWEECYLGVTDAKLMDEIRAIYVRLIFDLYINIGTNFVTQETKHVFNFIDVLSPQERGKKSMHSAVSIVDLFEMDREHHSKIAGFVTC
jgi:hypothetical protein